MSSREEEKKRLAKKLERVLNSIFAKYISAYRNSISLSISYPSSANLIGDLIQEAINSHTIRVQDSFKGTMLTDISPASLDDSFFDVFLRNLEQWRLSNTATKAYIINNTNDFQANSSLDDARILLSNEGQEFSRNELSILASMILGRRFSVRSQLISEIETQSASESTKYIESSTASQSPVISSRYLISNMWNSVLDGLERPTHHEADAQERPVGISFIVGGFSLRYPGDPNAPLREVAGCRCFLTSTIREL